MPQTYPWDLSTITSVLLLPLIICKSGGVRSINGTIRDHGARASPLVSIPKNIFVYF